MTSRPFLKRFAAISMVSVCAVASSCANPPTPTANFTASETKVLDPASIEKGKENYAMFCLACHGAEDAGIDSPSNLFDRKWYHGEGREGIEKTIRNGIVDKGMPGWGPMIPNEDIDALLDYLMSFQTTNSSTDA